MAESASRTQTISSASANTPDTQVFSRIFLLIEKQILKVVVFLPRCGVSHVAQLVLLRPVSESSSGQQVNNSVPVDLQICIMLWITIKSFNPFLSAEKSGMIGGGGGGGGGGFQ
jgi:hypothetical protein